MKTTKSSADDQQLKSLRSEVKVMIHIGRHMNIVNILGACSKNIAKKGQYFYHLLLLNRNIKLMANN